MDRFEAMSMLIEVADKGSFSAAARFLDVPVTTLTRKISDLETTLGTKLLQRSTRRIDLTDAGVTYLSAVRRIIEQVDEAEREVAGEFTAPKGRLVITAPVQFGQLHVLPVVTDFLALFPEINVSLLLLDRNVQLVEDHVDMAVRIGRLPDSSMISTTIGAMRMVTCASPGLLETHRMPASPADLLQLPSVTVDGPLAQASWQFRDPRRRAKLAVPVTPRLTVTTVEAAIRAAIRGAGVIRLFHYQVAQAVKAGELKIILEPYEQEPVPVSLLHASRGQMPLKMRSFLDFAVPRLRAVAAELRTEKK
ncbi:DNA-binding transcriptional regulator, LysR family [Rhizobium sp. NFR07]|uniref:LysR family transcriptional regulator n=1 Tax=Rhizobium sp. NFR07 TaxID=1566262 RepID=UPI0008E313DB|nr:LysR family transcriptional regulator [Rhizobium sp. NFR07]SFB58168.1 DNA-binding transcriptional regulator, LysR family [Rhizobium sp. NFR07]